MRTCRKGFSRLLCLALALILLMALPMQTQAAGKDVPPRAIAIVFDNSGSMYGPGNTAWCQATYAIEVFAAMMNPGDILEIYPMSAIEVNGRTYDDANPLAIRNLSEVPQIREIFTPHAQLTPITTVDAAYQGVKKHTGMEQWLIVLTDGAVFYDSPMGNTLQDTQGELSKKLTAYNNDTNVMYLGIGTGEASKPDITGSQQHLATVTGPNEDVLFQLTRMCNMIFGRDALNNAGKNFNVDLPMNKLIVFVQGKDVSDVELTCSNGSLSKPVSSYSPHYSTLGAGDYISTPKETLQGSMIIYENCPAGDYTISCSGTPSSISVYYEPNVDLTAVLLDKNGNPTNELVSGTNYIHYGMVDPEGNFVESELLGDTLYTITYTIDGETFTVTSDEAGSIPVELDVGQVLDVQVEVTYLSGYYLKKDGAELGFPKTAAAAPIADLVISCQNQESCDLSALPDIAPFPLALSYEDTVLTGAELENTQVTATIDGTDLTCQVEKTDQGWMVKPVAATELENVTCKAYTITVTAEYLLSDGQVAKGQASYPFRLEDDRTVLDMTLEPDDAYIVISDIADTEPFVASFTSNGQPLTDAEINALDIAADLDGQKVQVTPIPGQSAVEIRLDPDADYGTGDHTLTVTASGKDALGAPVNLERTADVELQNYPQWLRWLVIFLILLVIFLLIRAYLNAKVLPKKVIIRGGSTRFTVGGRTITGSAKCQYPKGGKRSANLTVTSPPCSSVPEAKGGISIDVVAVSPRKTKSAARKAGVVAVRPVHGVNVDTIQVGTNTFRKDSTGKFVKAGAKAPTPGKGKQPKEGAVMFEIGSNSNMMISGRTSSGSSFSCICKVQFL